jgi:parallel beta-helix repeat protein
MAFTFCLRRQGTRPRDFHPRLEALEGREVPSVGGPQHVLQVHQGDPHAAFQTIQSAVNAARPGDEVLIFGGTYREAVTVSTPGLTLQGAPGARVVIQKPGAANGLTVQSASAAPLAGFTLANVTVRGFTANGVFLSGVTNFVLKDLTVQNNGDYGVFPLLSANGLIDDVAASGSNDTGIYVGESSNVTIHNNQAFNNVNGIEIENSVGVTATQNVVYNNTVGILEDLLPGLSTEVASGNVISGNVVFGNNRPNTASPGDLAAVEPPGTGIAVLGGSQTRVLGNVVFGNALVGIAVLSGADLLPPGSYQNGPDPNPNNTLVAGNIVLGNGFVPPPPGFPQPADLLWTGTGTGNHWKDNIFGSSTPGTLP